MIQVNESNYIQARVLDTDKQLKAEFWSSEGMQITFQLLQLVSIRVLFLNLCIL